jgi:transposase
MKGVELYGQVRRAVYVEGMSRREAARRFGIDPRTVAKMLAFSVPPGYRRSQPPARPKLDAYGAVIDRILEEDKSRPAKQQHTSQRILERLRDEYGYSGEITIVRAYVHEQRQTAARDVRAVKPRTGMRKSTSVKRSRSSPVRSARSTFFALPYSDANRQRRVQYGSASRARRPPLPA